jgi:hypothetical protein
MQRKKSNAWMAAGLVLSLVVSIDSICRYRNGSGWSE